MESILQIREALEARSSTASLEDLRTRGKSRVKVIRPEHIAAMVNDAVARTIAKSGLVSETDAKKLADNSQIELRQIMRERDRDSKRIQELEHELEVERTKVQELEQRLEEVGSSGHAAPAAGSAENSVIAKLMLEMAEMKAQLAKREAAPAPAPAAASPGLEAAIERLAGSLEDRLDKFGRKLGVSSAVEADAVDYGALFKDHGTEAKVESNLDAMEASKSKGAGIGGALEKLKKLRGS